MQTLWHSLDMTFHEARKTFAKASKKVTCFGGVAAAGGLKGREGYYQYKYTKCFIFVA